MKTIIIARYGESSDTIQKYKIICNEKVIGKISFGESKEYEVEDSEIELYVKLGLIRSNKIVVKLKPDEVKCFECGSSTKKFELSIKFDLLDNPERHLWIKEIT